MYAGTVVRTYVYRRTCVFPNVGFQLQLQLLEKQLAEKKESFEYAV